MNKFLEFCKVKLSEFYLLRLNDLYSQKIFKQDLCDHTEAEHITLLLYIHRAFDPLTRLSLIYKISQKKKNDVWIHLI